MVSSSSNTTLLEWETFEFSTAPKWDIRFDGEDNQNDSHNNNSKKKGKTTTNVNSRNKGNTTTMLHQQVSPEEWNQIVHDERDKDKALSRKLEQQHAALSAIDPTLVQRAIHVLSKVVQPERYQRIAHILQQRTRHVRFLFENPGNPSNVWACLRTLDSFGIQHVGIIMDPDFYEQGGGKAAIVQKRGMRTAMGSAQWMTVHHYLTTTQALQHVRDELGFCIVASDVHEGAYDIRTLPWSQLSLSKHKYSTATSASSPTTTNAASSSTTTTSADPPPICIVMGNEGKGISEEMRQACDATFYLPMSGFAESFNLSVATAVTCAHLSAASTTTVDGIVKPLLLQPGDLDPHEFRCLLLKGLLYSFAQKRTGHALLLNDGIVLPPEMNWI
jgi:tRNA (guanosine-2'-O-)-methyltransferase